MRILFDYLSTQPYGNVEYHGGGDYGRGVLKALVCHLNSARGSGHKLLLLADTSSEGDAGVLDEVAGYPFVQVVSARDYTGLEAVISENHVDTLYSPVPYHLPRMGFLKSLSGTRICGTIHGLRPLEFQDGISIVHYRRGVVAKVKGVLRAVLRGYYRRRVRGEVRELIGLMGGSLCTVSHHSKALLLTNFPQIAPDSITVAYRVPDRKEKPPEVDIEDVLRANRVGSRFFLCASGARYEKNILRVVRAISRFSIRDDTVEFVFLGVTESQETYFRSLLPTAMWDRCHFLGYVPSEAYRCFLASAIALIYPSLSEGFGYPPIEAGYYGTPTIASGTTSIPEVCADAALYVDPRSEQEIAVRINELLTTAGLRERLSSAAKRRVEELAKIAASDEHRIVDYIMGS